MRKIETQNLSNLPKVSQPEVIEQYAQPKAI